MGATEFQAIQTELTNQLTSLKSLVTKRDGEVKSLGEAREETGRAIDGITSKIDELVEADKLMREKYAALEVEMQKISAENNRVGDDGDDGEEAKTLGEIFTNSESYQNAVVKGGRGNTERIGVKSFLDSRMSVKGLSGMERKALTTIGGGAALITPHRVAGIFGSIARPFKLRDLFASHTTEERTVEYVEETYFYQLAAKLETAASIADTEITVAENVAGFYKGQVITLSANTIGAEQVTVSAVAEATRKLTVSALTRAHSAGSDISADDFAYTPETKVKPRAKAEFELIQRGMKTIAHWLPASRQMIRNKAMLRDHIDTRLIEGLEQSMERQILYGNGDTNQLHGILTNARTQTYSWSNGLAGDTMLDAIRRALTLAQLANYPIDGLILHPIDFERIETLKGSDGHYLWVTVGEGGGNRLWRIPVVISAAIDQGSFLLGAFRMGAAIWDGEVATIRIAEQHANFFIENMVAILAEQDMLLTTYRPAAFVHGTFDAAPTP